MQSIFWRKGFVLAILLLFVCAISIPSTIGTIEIKVIVTDNTSRGYIQELIDNANPGDSLFIPIGVYHENIIINKKINLLGENKDLTIIDGG